MPNLIKVFRSVLTCQLWSVTSDVCVAQQNLVSIIKRQEQGISLFWELITHSSCKEPCMTLTASLRKCLQDFILPSPVALCARQNPLRHPQALLWNNFIMRPPRMAVPSYCNTDSLVCICMIWYDMIWYDMIWYDMIWYDMIWYDMIWYDMIWYDMIWLALCRLLFTGTSYPSWLRHLLSYHRKSSYHITVITSNYW